MGVQFVPVRQCCIPCECMQQTQELVPDLPGRRGHFLLGSTFVPCTMAPLYSYLFTCSPFPLPCQQRPCFIYLCVRVVCLAPYLGLQGTLVREHTELNKCSLQFQKAFIWLPHIPSFPVRVCCSPLPITQRLFKPHLTPFIYYWVSPNKNHVSACTQHLKFQLHCHHHDFSGVADRVGWQLGVALKRSKLSVSGTSVALGKS